MTALAGHTNSYHPYSAEQAYAGLAEAGYRAVELSSVPGWTEHVDVRVDFGRVLEILRNAGYDGPYSVEVEFDGSWPPLAEVTAVMRASREALARHGLS